MRIATWNVNSVRQRLHFLSGWLKDNAIDVACLQEIKCTDENFPRQEFEDIGYNVETFGQKTFNGVAILSKFPIEDIRRGLPGFEHDPLSRYIEASIVTKKGAARIASIYAPNGNPLGTEKFTYKLEWLEKLRLHAQQLLMMEEPIVLTGDFNIIPENKDVHDPRAWVNDALFQPESRAAYRALVNLGYTDAFRLFETGDGHYTFWDYQAGAWQKNNGIRIDFAMLSPQAVDILKSCTIDKEPRALEKPSDHVPVITVLDI
ncbi:MAG: exodeoxyribonuclease III [Pseudomonadota bacterium]